MAMNVYINEVEDADGIQKSHPKRLYDSLVEAAGPNTTTSNAFQTKLTYATGTLIGNYLVHFTCRANNTGFNGEVRLRNEADGITLVGPEVCMTPSGQRCLVSGFASITLDGTTKNIGIQIRDVVGGNLQTIRDMKIYLQKFE